MITNHSVFGGNIEIEDFNTSCPNKRRIQNQMEAVHLQQTLEKRKYRTEKEKKYKTMNLEQLKKMKVISNTDGRPAEHLTDETWQKEFAVQIPLFWPVRHCCFMWRQHRKRQVQILK